MRARSPFGEQFRVRQSGVGQSGFVALALTFAACSGEADGPHASSGGSSAGGSGGETENGGSSGGAASGGAPSSDGVSPVALFPLTVGNRWTYAHTELGPGTTCPTGLAAYVRTVERTETVDGRLAHVVSWPCAPDVELLLAPEANELLQWFEGSTPIWSVTLAAPVQEGHRWTDPQLGIEFTWRSAGTVTVPAGVFEDCWTRTAQLTGSSSGGSQSTFTYCAGIGPVRQWNDSYELVLTSYELE